ncbi:MAG: hypothetical protein ACM3WS_06445 [Bacillota bacterium]
MKIAMVCLLLTAALGCGGAAAAEKEQEPAAREAEVQKDIDAIVANCEKKKLPTEQEIECIEQGYLQFMGEAAPEGQ